MPGSAPPSGIVPSAAETGGITGSATVSDSGETFVRRRGHDFPPVLSVNSPVSRFISLTVFLSSETSSTRYGRTFTFDPEIRSPTASSLAFVGSPSDQSEGRMCVVSSTSSYGGANFTTFPPEGFARIVPSFSIEVTVHFLPSRLNWSPTSKPSGA